MIKQAVLSNFEREEWLDILQQTDKLQSVECLLASVVMQQRLEYGSVVGSLQDESVFLEDTLAHQRTGFPLRLPNCVQDRDGNFAEDEAEVVYETYQDDDDEEDEEEMDEDEEMDFHP